MRQMIVVATALPTLLALALIAVTGWESVFYPLFMLFVVVVLGLAIVSLAAPLILWSRVGARSFLVPAAFVAGAALWAPAIMFVPRLILERTTPIAPEHFLRGERQEELERLATRLLEGGPRDSIEARVLTLGFHRVQLDTINCIVTLGHCRGRTWFEYLYSEGDLHPSVEHPYDRRIGPRWYFRRW